MDGACTVGDCAAGNEEGPAPPQPAIISAMATREIFEKMRSFTRDKYSKVEKSPLCEFNLVLESRLAVGRILDLPGAVVYAVGVLALNVVLTIDERHYLVLASTKIANLALLFT